MKKLAIIAALLILASNCQKPETIITGTAKISSPDQAISLNPAITKFNFSIGTWKGPSLIIQYIGDNTLEKTVWNNPAQDSKTTTRIFLENSQIRFLNRWFTDENLAALEGFKTCQPGAPAPDTAYSALVVGVAADQGSGIQVKTASRNYSLVKCPYGTLSPAVDSLMAFFRQF